MPLGFCQFVEPSTDAFDVERGEYCDAGYTCSAEEDEAAGAAFLHEIVVHKSTPQQHLRSVVPVHATGARACKGDTSRSYGLVCPFEALYDDALICILLAVAAANDHAPGPAMRRARARAVLDVGSLICTCRRFRAVMATTPPLQLEIERYRAATRGMLQPPPRRPSCIHLNDPNHHASFKCIAAASRYVAAHVTVAQVVNRV